MVILNINLEQAGSLEVVPEVMLEAVLVVTLEVVLVDALEAVPVVKLEAAQAVILEVDRDQATAKGLELTGYSPEMISFLRLSQ